MDLLHSIRTQWEQNGREVPPGATSEELNAFERRHGVALPPAMRDYFQIANGNRDMGTDFFRFWTLQEVKLVSEELTDPIHTDRNDYPQCFIFADYLLWCWAYAVCLSNDANADEPVYIIGGTDKIVIAATFLEFMQKYAANPDSLL